MSPPRGAGEGGVSLDRSRTSPVVLRPHKGGEWEKSLVFLCLSLDFSYFFISALVVLCYWSSACGSSHGILCPLLLGKL